MFSSIDNVSGLKAVFEILENKETDFSPAECILEALKLCLEFRTLYLMRKFIYRKMALLWDHICPVLIVTLLCTGLT